MLNLTGTMAAFQFDLAAAVALWRAQESLIKGEDSEVRSQEW
jgi:hypothetical protein